MKQKDTVLNEEQHTCYHCGDHCNSLAHSAGNKHFCCQGCRMVYELLQENNLCTYYSLNDNPGVSPQSRSGRYAYLDNSRITEQLICFRNEAEVHITFYTPRMHCSSCIWLLENLHRLNPGICSSRVDFLKKEVHVVFTEKETRLSEIAALLAGIGYEPLITLNDLEKEKAQVRNYAPLIKIGIAGFCFGNIMMLSFPEYFSLGNFHDQEELKPFFGYANLLLSLPVFFYCASEFFLSAWKNLRQRHLNIDAPIALAILVTFARSVYEIGSGTGAGYMDSMSGIVFFMLLGRYFQNRTYDSLSFSRDYRSYFPVAVEVAEAGRIVSVPVNELKKGQRFGVRSNEIIPADGKLLSEYTHIDYSFVTGESAPVRKMRGEQIYAGARQLEGAIELEVTRETAQSYLTRLWNNDVSGKVLRKSNDTFVDRVNVWFTAIVLTIAFASLGFWAFTDLNRAINAFTAVLIVACPCGLLLVSSFANAAMLRVFGRKKLYLRNAAVIEKLAKADTLVFDKTGTITHGSEVEFMGPAVKEETGLAAVLCAQSAHPLSRKIASLFSAGQPALVNDFREIPGMGIKGEVNGKHVIIGSSYFVLGRHVENEKDGATRVFLSIDGMPLGYFRIKSAYRPSLEKTLTRFSVDYSSYLLSGDQDSEKESLAGLFDPRNMHFGQTPGDKFHFIEKLQNQGKQVLMLGDGLNDGAALKQSDVGIAVSDDTNTFTPASDAILDGSAFGDLPAFLRYARTGRRIIAVTFAFSVIYNMIGLFFAVQGSLEPVIAAMLMPSSTASIILITTLSANLAGRILFKSDIDQVSG